MHQYPVRFLSALFAIILLGASNFAYAESEWQKRKDAFSEEFQQFKRDGLSTQDIEQLTQKLLDTAGTDIDGTGLKALLESMNQQPERAARMLDEKAEVENLIDLVGATSALVNDDDPADEMVDVYDSIADDMRYFADAAKAFPGAGRVAPLLNSTATQLETGKVTIRKIAESTKARNQAVNDYDSWVYGESNSPPPSSSLELKWEETPTKEDIEWEKLRREEKAHQEACMDRCRKQYDAYNEIATKRARARDAAAALSKDMGKARSKADRRRQSYNGLVEKLRSSLDNKYKTTLAQRDAEKEKMKRASEEKSPAYELHRQFVNRLEEKLSNIRKDLRVRIASIKKAKKEYMLLKGEFHEIQASRRGLSSIGRGVRKLRRQLRK